MSIELFIGAFLPPLIDVINKRVLNPKVRYLISLLVCIIVGVAFNYNTLSLENVLESSAIIFASAQTVYKTYYGESKMREVLLKN